MKLIFKRSIRILNFVCAMFAASFFTGVFTRIFFDQPAMMWGLISANYVLWVIIGLL